ncbi:MAG: UDP-N-acetylmuramate:L-alanyl-gamma-D-glutamyl-meso-diaminopimelate ligase [Snodgrassella sp.]|nr:UDP-N-acetylmuramate:L-alanyl-gamma-D-glutamyl-meso-diaminopimelate ligase [Snodgrassella sp.]
MQHVHIIGIGGTFMGGIAAIAKEAGYRVTGCDAKMYPPMSTQLAELGIEVVEGFEAAQLDRYTADIYVIGNVARRGMPVIEAILNQGLPYTSGPQWLSEHILQKHWVLAVAGTHGKTTTASMLAWVLEDSGLEPGFLIGGVPENFAVSARLPKNPLVNANIDSYFVIEADEYDTAFFDKRSKFIHYRPRTAILNNLEYDHADIFANLAAIQTQFHHLIRTIPSEGLIVNNDQSSALEEVLAQGCWSQIQGFGSNQDWQIGTIRSNGGFDVLYRQQIVGHVEWDLLGQHNRMNALAVIAAASHIGIPVQQSCAALGRFKNVKRRMEIKGVVQGITVYDDFAHHPTAIATTIEGLRQKIGPARILAVFEPRSNTMKLGAMKAALCQSLVQANIVYCYAGGINWDVAAALGPLENKVQVFHEMSALIKAIVNDASSGDHILVMSNGSFGGIHQQLLDGLQNKPSD